MNELNDVSQLDISSCKVKYDPPPSDQYGIEQETITMSDLAERVFLLDQLLEHHEDCIAWLRSRVDTLEEKLEELSPAN